jgi:hypothetical protein
MISASEHYATAVDDGDGIPAPSPQDQDVILEAWREVLGQVLHERDNNWKQQLRAIKAGSRAAVAALRANAAEIRSMMEAMIEKRLAQIHQPADGREGPRGEPGLRGEAGPPGKIESVHGYVEDAVCYRGDIVTHCGSTYQARCDTAREPPHEDWICLARAGQTVRTDAMAARPVCVAHSRLVRAIEHSTLSRLTAAPSLRDVMILAIAPVRAGS